MPWTPAGSLPHHRAVTGSDLFASFAPDERALLRWVAPQLDATAIEEIAAADYGFDVPGNRRELTALVHSPWLPDELIRDPAEVLALTRWTEPADRRGHLKRLFACTLLVRARTAAGNPVDSLAPLVDSAWKLGETPLVDSARELGETARDAAVHYLAWCRLNQPGDWRDDPSSPMFLTLAILLLSAEASTSAALAAVLLDELDAALTSPGLPWRRRPRSPLFTRRDTDDAATRRLWSTLVTRCLTDNPTVTDPRLTALAAALHGDPVTPLSNLRPQFPTP
jgi:hypothetical protein